MVTRRYAHILDEDRRSLATAMENGFYNNSAETASSDKGALGRIQTINNPTPPALDANALAAILSANPELLMKALQSIQFANPA